MNIQQLKQVPIGTIVERLGGQFDQSAGNNRDRYKSPFRDETKGSFYIFRDTNKWHDFGHVGRNSGDTLDLLCEYLNNKGRPDSVSDALALADQLLTGLTVHGPVGRPTEQKDTNRLIIDQVRDELSPSSLGYVRSVRGITDRGIIRQYLKQVHFHFEKTPGIRLFAVGFPNDKGGFELRTQIGEKQIKYAAGDKTITQITGSSSSRLSIFEGFFNFLTDLQLKKVKTPEYDVTVLNSNTLAHVAIENIRKKGYSFVDFYRDNDGPGKKTLELFKSELPGIEIRDRSILYKGFEDYNQMHVQTMARGERLRLA